MNRLAGVLAALTLMSAPALARAEPIELPIQIDNNLVFVEVELNGRPKSFILDTGAPTIVDQRAAQEARLETRLFAQTDGIGATPSPVYRLQGGRLSVAGVATPSPIAIPLAGVERCFNAVALDVEGGEHDPTAARPGGPRRVDGILGREFFNDHVVQIDYAASRVRFWPKGQGPSTAGVSLPLQLTASHMFVDVRLAARGKPAVPAHLMVDTGFALPFGLVRPFIEANGLGPPAGVGAPWTSCGLNGEVAEPSVKATLDRVELGPLRVEAPVTEYSRTVMATSFDGYLGGAALRRWRVTVDVPGRRLMLEDPAPTP